MKTRQKYWRRAVASAVMYSLIFGQVVQSAHAASTDISDVPMAVKNQAPPNIMFMIDNSGSMLNIVPDTPYTGNPLFLASCPAANTVAGGVAAPAFPTSTFDIRIVSNVQKIRIASTDFNWGTGAGQRCFNPALRYNAKLNAYSSCGAGCLAPDDFSTDAVYTGDYLNWYFGSAPTAWGAGASRKPGTLNRIEIARTSAKAVLDSLATSNVRVGLSTYNGGEGGSLREIMGNLSSNVLSMKTKIDLLTPVTYTPLAETLSDIGRYFATGNTGNLTIHPGQKNQASVSVSNFFTANTGPGSRSSALVNNSGQTIVAPIQYSCQRSFAVLMTDGQSNDDQQMSSLLVDYKGEFAANPSLFIAGTPGGSTNNFGRKIGRIYESLGSDYLDDVAKALFEIDLRPDLLPTSGAKTTKNNVETYTIGFADEQVLNDPLMRDTAIAGNGQFLNASNSAELTAAFRSAVNNILSKTASATAVAVSTPNVIPGDNAAYAVSYNSGNWTGDLQAYPIDLATGQPNTATPLWTGGSAQAQLNARTSASRKIASYTGVAGTGQGIQFQPATATTATKLSAAQQALLNSPTTPPGPSDGAAVVAYLRGDRSGETSGTYRSRVHLLGDIIHAEPIVVREPANNYGDAGYSAFKTANASRTKLVLQGANDGMLHAFNAATGAEEWAYVPNLVMANLNNLSSKNGFTHKYTVNGTAVAGDVDFNNSGGVVGTPDWRTLVVGGLGKGGRGYYALDVTQLPGPETDLAGKVLWEFPNSATNATVRANIGYSFGRPIIVKTRAQGWVALVTSGYNNGTNSGDSGGDGQGYLFVLNAKTGALIKAIGTGVGTATDPSGLAHISGYVTSRDVDNTVDYVYGGDLKGNVWRFDLTHNASIAQWGVTKLATLVDASGNFQPVTTEPELANVRVTGGVYKRFVYVGTGRYLGDSDIPGSASPNANASQTQTMYGLVDDLSAPGGSNPVITPLRASLQQQTFSINADGSRVASANSLNFSTQKGWYLDLPAAGEKLDTHPTLAFSALVFNTNVPSADPCLPGGLSFNNVLDYQTGGFLPGSPDGKSSIRRSDTLASRAVLIQVGGKIVSLTQNWDTTIIPGLGIIPSGGTVTRRRSWIELMQ